MCAALLQLRKCNISGCPHEVLHAVPELTQPASDGAEGLYKAPYPTRQGRTMQADILQHRCLFQHTVRQGHSRPRQCFTNQISHALNPSRNVGESSSRRIRSLRAHSSVGLTLSRADCQCEPANPLNASRCDSTYLLTLTGKSAH